MFVYVPINVRFEKNIPYDEIIIMRIRFNRFENPIVRVKTRYVFVNIAHTHKKILLMSRFLWKKKMNDDLINLLCS